MLPLESQPAITATPRPKRREWGLILAIILVGFVLRAMFPGRMAVEHFDEGVYASNLWFNADEGFRYPARHLYAPPLVPWLLEWSQILFGPTHWGTMLVGIVCGTLTIGLLWWVVRTWFGMPAGIATAILAACSDYHGLFSRTALTEPVLCFLLPLGVYFLWVSLVTLRLRHVLLAGIITGLAWSTKYNGWLPLAIGAAGLSAWAISPSSPQRSRRYLFLGLIGVIALIVFSPVWWGLQDDGGYLAVQQNHARYLVGMEGWWDAFAKQLACHRYLDGPLSWLGLFSAVLCAIALGRTNRQTPQPNPRGHCLWAIASSLFLTVLAMWFGTSVVCGAMALIWLVIHCPWWGNQRRNPEPAFDLAYWLVAAWFLGLLVSTPLYTPYPRLSLPWVLTAWIGTAAMIGSPNFQRWASGQCTWQHGRSGTVCLLFMGMISVSAFVAMMSNPPSPPAMWEDRTGLERIAKRIHQEVTTRYSDEALVYVYAEPALFFHLKADQLALTAPVADLGFADQSAPIPVLLAVGPHAKRSESFRAEFQKHGDRWELLGHFLYRPSTLVLLDQFAPQVIAELRFPREQNIWLYRLKPP